jgi:hypothetical protein
MSVMFGFTGLTTYGDILFHAITVAQLVAQLVAQVKREMLAESSDHCKQTVAGVAKWQTHRT